MQPDVIVVGGGVSGLAAAGHLARAGGRVRLLEARGRLGGRILSLKHGAWGAGVELGAEFVHGGNADLHALLKRDGIRTRPVQANMWLSLNGHLALMPHYWDDIGRIAGRIPRRDHGWSFQQFLHREGSELPPLDRELIRIYVESFNAASAGRISAHALRDHRAGADTTDLKLRGTYDAVVRSLRKEWPARRVDLRLQAIVTEIRWRPGHVTVRTRSRAGGPIQTHEARAAVITLPLGVLKSGRVKFTPPLAGRRSLIRSAGWGQVVRIVIHFKRGFWAAPFIPRALGRKGGREFGFVNAPDESVPVWWALNPPAPILTGWAGGKIADRLAGKTPAAVRDEALSSLAHIFGTGRRQVAAWVDDWAMHDWRKDPFALGAYSYPVAGAEDIGERLAEPVKGTLFFAGEALATDYGTVHGAIATGRRAGREAAAALEANLLGPQELISSASAFFRGL